MTYEQISAQDVEARRLTLRGEDVLIRTHAIETSRAIRRDDGTKVDLVVPHFASKHVLGDVFYGEVVACGPGRVVRGATLEACVEAVWGMILDKSGDPDGVEDVRAVLAPLFDRPTVVPPPWKVGDHVVVRQGFGAEVQLAEGTHYVVTRGNSQHGHGIVASYSPGHVHCWHLDLSDAWEGYLCSCGEKRKDGELETALPACLDCPPGPRVAEAKFGVPVTNVKVHPGPSQGELEMEERAREISLRVEEDDEDPSATRRRLFDMGKGTGGTPFP